VKIPDDMNLIGFSNTPFANSLNPSLTTITQPTQLMAEKSVELLLQMLKKKNKKNYFEFETYFLDCSIEHRKSTSSL
jgi:LacI family transcriptional regulator